MSDDLNIFGDVDTAIIWMCGYRALCGTPHPGNMRSLSWRLIEDGNALRFCMDSNSGRISCIAMLPRKLTEEQARRCEWFGFSTNDLDQLGSMPTMGSA